MGRACLTLQKHRKISGYSCPNIYFFLSSANFSSGRRYLHVLGQVIIRHWHLRDGNHTWCSRNRCKPQGHTQAVFFSPGGAAAVRDNSTAASGKLLAFLPKPRAPKLQAGLCTQAASPKHQDVNPCRTAFPCHHGAGPGGHFQPGGHLGHPCASLRPGLSPPEQSSTHI